MFTKAHWLLSLRIVWTGWARLCFPEVILYGFDSATFLKTELTFSGSGTALSCFTAGKKLEIIFTQPVRSGDVYTFWVIPALFLGRETVNEQILGPKLTEKELRTTLVGMLEKRESLPNEQYSPGENVVYAKSFVTYEFSDEQDRYRP